MKLDLNLLRVFDELYDLRSVSRAADRLNLTQSAVSHALARLRDQLGDPLFLRSQGGLRPTPRAATLAPVVRTALAALRDALAPASFDPGSTSRLFTICASPYFSVTLLPLTIQRARAQAPDARFRIVAATTELASELDDGSVDVALGGFARAPSGFTRTPLLRERLVWAGRAGDDLADIAGRPHLAMTRPRQLADLDRPPVRGMLEDRIEIVPATVSPGARVPLTIYDPLSALAFLRTSDMVALLPRQLALRLTDRQGIAFVEATDREPVELSMLWPSRSADDPAHAWLRGLIVDAAAALT